MTPPLPPWRTDMRRTAAAAHRIEPETLTREHAVEPLGRDLVDPGRHPDDAGIVDQPVETAEGLVHRVENRSDTGFAADIAFNRNRLAAGRLDRLDDRICGRGGLRHS